MESPKPNPLDRHEDKPSDYEGDDQEGVNKHNNDDDGEDDDDDDADEAKNQADKRYFEDDEECEHDIHFNRCLRCGKNAYDIAGMDG
jgi:hypothetical protein